jgi:hypothetical protein
MAMHIFFKLFLDITIKNSIFYINGCQWIYLSMINLLHLYGIAENGANTGKESGGGERYSYYARVYLQISPTIHSIAFVRRWPICVVQKLINSCSQNTDSHVSLF